MIHRNAPLTPEGRYRLVSRVQAGRPIAHVAAEAGIARSTLSKWVNRYRAEGEAGLLDRPGLCQELWTGCKVFLTPQRVLLRGSR